MSGRRDFRAAISHGVMVFDGPMGTEFYRRHVFTNRCYDELCLSDAKLVRQVHSDYCDAGADVLTTNTFGANRLSLAQFGLREKLAEINRAGAQLAREIADQSSREVFVAGSIGPVPLGPQTEGLLEEMILEQAEALLAGGADFILFETQRSRAALVHCAAAMRRLPEVQFVLSCAVYDDGESASGEPVEALFAPLDPGLPQPVAWGLNCGAGPDGLLGAVERVVRCYRGPLVVQPNAGQPKEIGNRHIYLCSPEYLASYARKYVELGVTAVGGCCGTTPEHIAEVARSIKPLARAELKAAVKSAAPAVALKAPVPLAQRSQLGRHLAEGKWVTTVELLPPKGYELGPTIEKSRVLQQHGVTAINIPDGPRASARISPLVTAMRIQQEAQIETILHFCCRDRNLIGMQADLLGCAACGVRNILFVTGDPPKLGNYPQATGVFDADSIGMVAVQRRLNGGLDLGGQPIDPPTAALIGVGADPSALDLRRELDRFRQKVEAGAEFAITQPVFDPEALLRFLDQVQHHGIPVIAGIWPLASYRNALFMKNEVPGVVVPDSVLQRMASVESREAQLAMGVQIAREAVQRIADRVAGIQVSAPLGRIEIALAVIGQ